MILIPIVALIVGLLLGRLIAEPVTSESGTYLAMAVLAGLDSVCGGSRSALEGKFHTDVFVTGCISNILIAFFLAWLGDKIGANLFLVAAIVLGWRIFTNLSLMRRYALSRWHDSRQRRKVEAEQSAKLEADPVSTTQSINA